MKRAEEDRGGERGEKRSYTSHDSACSNESHLFQQNMRLATALHERCEKIETENRQTVTRQNQQTKQNKKSAAEEDKTKKKNSEPGVDMTALQRECADSSHSLFSQHSDNCVLCIQHYIWQYQHREAGNRSSRGSAPKVAKNNRIEKAGEIKSQEQ